MIYASWSRRRRRSRQESLGNPARRRKAGLDQAWWMESVRSMRRKTRKKMANRSVLGPLGAACECQGKRVELFQWQWGPQELEVERCILG